MSQISKAEFLRQFPVGTKFIATNVTVLGTIIKTAKREVVKHNSYEFVSKILDGEKVGREISFTLKGVKIDRQENERYHLSDEAGEFAIFVKDER